MVQAHFSGPNNGLSLVNYNYRTCTGNIERSTRGQLCAVYAMRQFIHCGLPGVCVPCRRPRAGILCVLALFLISPGNFPPSRRWIPASGIGGGIPCGLSALRSAFRWDSLHPIAIWENRDGFLLNTRNEKHGGFSPLGGGWYRMRLPIKKIMPIFRYAALKRKPIAAGTQSSFQSVYLRISARKLRDCVNRVAHRWNGSVLGAVPVRAVRLGWVESSPNRPHFEGKKQFWRLQSTRKYIALYLAHLCLNVNRGSVLLLLFHVVKLKGINLF